MIVSGKVDADRIYVMGNSFGGLATVEFTEKYPDLVAGAVVMCPALSYSQESTSNLVQMKNVPVWFAQATNDNVIPIKTSRNAVSTLQRLGAVEVRFTEFSDEEMLAAGAAYGFHEADIAVMADESFVEWLFDKRKAY
jgi:predicted peptidase